MDLVRALSTPNRKHTERLRAVKDGYRAYVLYSDLLRHEAEHAKETPLLLGANRPNPAGTVVQRGYDEEYNVALWHIEYDWHTCQVKLTYVDHPGAKDALVQRCGQTALSAEGDLEAWVIDQTVGWDLVNTTRGSFVRQVVPKNLTV